MRDESDASVGEEDVGADRRDAAVVKRVVTTRLAVRDGGLTRLPSELLVRQVGDDAIAARLSKDKRRWAYVLGAARAEEVGRREVRCLEQRLIVGSGLSRMIDGVYGKGVPDHAKI